MDETNRPGGFRLIAALILVPALALPGASAVAADAASAAQDHLRPLYARPATTAGSFQMDAFFEYFDGLPLQEAVDLKGWSAGLDFTLPFRPNMQIRFLLPLRTEAEGQLVNGGGEIDIEGWGGTFDFASIYFEHQLLGTEGGPNRVSYFLGLGNRTAVLETGTPDRYNHRGRSAHFGVRYDRVLESGGRLYLDSELRSYEESDDLNPGSLISDRFFLGVVTAAWLGQRRGALTPGLELTTEIADNYIAASLVPELIIRGSNAVDLKFGFPVGLSTDAPDWGAQFRLSLSF